MGNVRSIDAAEVDHLTEQLRKLRDAMLAIANAGPDIPPAAMRGIAYLAARAIDDMLTELAS